MGEVEIAKTIVALRNEKGSYNLTCSRACPIRIVALRNEKGSYNTSLLIVTCSQIVALQNKKGSYNSLSGCPLADFIVALR